MDLTPEEREMLGLDAPALPPVDPQWEIKNRRQMALHHAVDIGKAAMGHYVVDGESVVDVAKCFEKYLAGSDE